MQLLTLVVNVNNCSHILI